MKNMEVIQKKVEKEKGEQKTPDITNSKQAARLIRTLFSFSFVPESNLIVK